MNAIPATGEEAIDAMTAVTGLRRTIFALVCRLRSELHRMRGIPEGLNAEQALMLAACDETTITAGRFQDLAYFGTNASYNLRRMSELGLIERSRGTRDQRLIMVTLTGLGLEVGRIVRDFVDEYVGAQWGDLPRHIPPQQ